MVFILSSSHFFFLTLSQIFSRLFPKLVITFPINTFTRAIVCGVWWCTLLTQSPQCTCTQVTPHLKQHCSYRKRMAVPAHCCKLSQIVHGTQNRLRMCTAIERNMEQYRHWMCNVTEWCVGVTSVVVEKQQLLHILSLCVCVCHVSYSNAKRAAACLSQHYFPHYHINQTISWKIY